MTNLETTTERHDAAERLAILKTKRCSFVCAAVVLVFACVAVAVVVWHGQALEAGLVAEAMEGMR